MATYTPPGWPTGVHPPGSDDFESTAVGWLLDVVPPDYRLHGVLRRYPVALATLARYHTKACVEGARQGYRTARTELAGALPPHAIDTVLAAYRKEGARLAATARAVGLVERALRGEALTAERRGEASTPELNGDAPTEERRSGEVSTAETTGRRRAPGASRRPRAGAGNVGAASPAAASADADRAGQANEPARARAAGPGPASAGKSRTGTSGVPPPARRRGDVADAGRNEQPGPEAMASSQLVPGA